MKYRGIKIVERKVVRYEVQHVDGRKLKTFGSAKAARAWIDGYMSAVKAFTPKDQERAQ